MDNFAIDILDRLSSAEDDDVRWTMVNKEIGKLGGSAVNFGLINTKTMAPIWFKSSMPEAWLSEYFERQYFFADPFIEHLNVSGDSKSVLTGTMRKDEAETQLHYDLNWGLRDAGFMTMHFIPLGGEKEGHKRGFTYCSPHLEKDVLNTEVEAKIRLVASLASAYMGNPPAESDAYRIVDYTLTPQERRVLHYLALGTRNVAIAYELGIAEVTVRKHLISIRKKLGAKTREHAISIAVSQGLLDL
ncbi:MAG: LuxR C-terminal-related transcriptional regulator [Donghicola eburneus]|nr:LuxR family transcriptional regulator [Donghicola eburneus]MCI5040231.1 LuxR C-terminal-related transcriptional regulator [Donghicola eburneus]